MWKKCAPVSGQNLGIAQLVKLQQMGEIWLPTNLQDGETDENHIYIYIYLVAIFCTPYLGFVLACLDISVWVLKAIFYKWPNNNIVHELFVYKDPKFYIGEKLLDFKHHILKGWQTILEARIFEGVCIALPKVELSSQLKVRWNAVGLIRTVSLCDSNFPSFVKFS